MNPTPAESADSAGAQFIFDALVTRQLRVKHLFGDATCDRRSLLDKALRATRAYTEPSERLQPGQGADIRTLSFIEM